MLNVEKKSKTRSQSALTKLSLDVVVNAGLIHCSDMLDLSVVLVLVVAVHEVWSRERMLIELMYKIVFARTVWV